jgi:hypothetical protein
MRIQFRKEKENKFYFEDAYGGALLAPAERFVNILRSIKMNKENPNILLSFQMNNENPNIFEHQGGPRLLRRLTKILLTK